MGYSSPKRREWENVRWGKKANTRTITSNRNSHRIHRWVAHSHFSWKLEVLSLAFDPSQMVYQFHECPRTAFGGSGGGIWRVCRRSIPWTARHRQKFVVLAANKCENAIWLINQRQIKVRVFKIHLIYSLCVCAWEYHFCGCCRLFSFFLSPLLRSLFFFFSSISVWFAGFTHRKFH